jgi:16S rRNA (uracil1498-N3)-methyltransferase
MPYFYGEREGDRVTIEGTDAAHLARSLRTKPGESISVVEAPGRLLTVRVDAVSSERVTGVITAEVEHRPEPEVQVTLAIAMLPAAALELVLARCTELGASGFVVVKAERSVARGEKRSRWAAICREASMLAGRLRVPEVTGPVSLAAAWRTAENPILLDRSAEKRLSDDQGSDSVTLFIGPEGGWTENELQVAGDHTRSLGPRNLRADTAAIASVAILLASSGDM